jgi:peptidylprolyl isomerase domain and WD repeat-containing protein 1
MEFGKKMSVEKELSRVGAVKYNNLVYDESGNFLIYSSLLGIKFVNLTTQKVSRLIGQREHLRSITSLKFCGYLFQAVLRTSPEPTELQH